MQKRRFWSMPEEDARTLLAQIEEKVRSSEIQVADKDALIRLRSLLEQDLGVVPPVILIKVDADQANARPLKDVDDLGTSGFEDLHSVSWRCPSAHVL
jgi:hypothetical protein